MNKPIEGKYFRRWAFRNRRKNGLSRRNDFQTEFNALSRAIALKMGISGTTSPCFPVKTTGGRILQTNEPNIVHADVCTISLVGKVLKKKMENLKILYP